LKGQIVNITKSKRRVAEFGEVFTPQWLVTDILDTVKMGSENWESRFLDPACGNGAFLVEVLKRKLDQVDATPDDRVELAIIALMSVYGIELQADNVVECRARLLATFAQHFEMLEWADDLQAAKTVLRRNIVHGNGLTFQTSKGHNIHFFEWSYVPGGMYKSQKFRYAFNDRPPKRKSTSTAPNAFRSSLSVRKIGTSELWRISDLSAGRIQDIEEEWHAF
jgi:hypothetical protein